MPGPMSLRSTRETDNRTLLRSSPRGSKSSPAATPTPRAAAASQYDATPAGTAAVDAVVLTPTLRAVSHADALAFYQRLRAANRALGCDFFEGVVMKRADSIYPVQMRSATEEFRGWVKHRFLT